MVLWEKGAGFGKISILKEFQDFLDLHIYGLLRMLTNCIGISGFFRKLDFFAVGRLSINFSTRTIK
jgi:hypothetical protein